MSRLPERLADGSFNVGGFAVHCAQDSVPAGARFHSDALRAFSRSPASHGRSLRKVGGEGRKAPVGARLHFRHSEAAMARLCHTSRCLPGRHAWGRATCACSAGSRHPSELSRSRGEGFTRIGGGGDTRQKCQRMKRQTYCRAGNGGKERWASPRGTALFPGWRLSKPEGRHRPAPRRAGRTATGGEKGSTDPEAGASC